MGRLSRPRSPKTTLSGHRSKALAAVLGGATYLHTASYDEALAIPTENARYDCSEDPVDSWPMRVELTEVVDPLGGSYYVEALTNRDREEGD